MAKTKTELIQVLIDKEQKKELLLRVNETDLTLSHYLRRLIASHLEEKKE